MPSPLPSPSRTPRGTVGVPGSESRERDSIWFGRRSAGLGGLFSWGWVAALCLAWTGHLNAAQAPAAVNPLPEFLLKDANPGSARYNTIVSPRDYRLQISAYYFGDAG